MIDGNILTSVYRLLLSALSYQLLPSLIISINNLSSEHFFLFPAVVDNRYGSNYSDTGLT